VKPTREEDGRYTVRVPKAMAVLVAGAGERDWLLPPDRAVVAVSGE
jgi:hypothetical protein